jgi:recombination protein RecR
MALRSRSLPLASPEIERLVALLAKLPGLGPRSARRAALHLLKKRDALMEPLGEALAEAAEKVRDCSNCGSLDTVDPCALCTAPERDDGLICVVSEVGDVWALERAGAYRGRYHVLGGVLSALDGVRPEDLRINKLIERASAPGVREVIIALSATVDGQTTAHYLTERLSGISASVTRLSHGVPVGGELELLDDGTLMAALSSRRPF